MEKVQTRALCLSPSRSDTTSQVSRKTENADDSSCGTVLREMKTEIKKEEEFTKEDIWKSLIDGAGIIANTECLQNGEIGIKFEDDLQGSSTLVVNGEVRNKEILEIDELEENESEPRESDEDLLQMLDNLKNTCPVCERKFRLPSRLRRHMIIHSDERKFKCSICTVGFKTLSTLHSHVFTHSAVKPFKCNMCPSTQCTKSALRKHIERKHGTGEKLIVCDICGMRFEGKSNLRKHVVRHYGKNVLCTVCGRLFYTEKDLRIHVAKTHELMSKEAPELFECSHCNRVYSYKPHLVNHIMSIHLQVKQYECYICDKSFAVKAQIQKHMGCHSKTKFFCNCGRSFTSRPSLDRHSLTHINYRPFTCAMCGLTFTQKSSVERHIVTNMEKEHYKRFGTCKPITGGRGGFYAFEEYL